MRKTLLGLLLFTFTLPTYGQIIEAQGSAAILAGDELFAREQATRDALQQALLISGAAVSSIQRLDNGSLRKEQIQIRTDGDIHQYRLKREEVRNGRMYITLQADIRSKRQICQNQHIVKDLTLAQLRLRSPELASYGALDDLPSQLSERLFHALMQAKQGPLARQILPTPLLIEPDALRQGDSATREELKAISLQSDSQYLLVGEINDLSIEEQGNWFSHWYQDPVRHFAMTLNLYDGLNGQLISQHRYQGKALWTFAKHQPVGSASQTFWQSSYGQEVAYQITRAAQDLERALSCAPVNARVIKQTEQGIYLNLGRRNGIKIGDQFRLLHQSEFRDDQHQQRDTNTPAMGLFEVQQVFNDSCLVSSLRQYTPLNIQLGDMAVLE